MLISSHLISFHPETRVPDTRVPDTRANESKSTRHKMRHLAHQEIVLGTEHVEGRAAARGFSPDRHMTRASALQDCAISECAIRERCSSSPTLLTCGLWEYSKPEQTADKCWRMCGMHATQGNTPRRTATHCNTRQHTATHGNKRQHTTTYGKTRQDRARQW